MRSLQLKFSLLVVALIAVGSGVLVGLALRHEQGALEAEIAKRGRTLAESLAGAAKEPLLEEDELTLDRLVQEVGREPGVVAARLRGRDGRVRASLDPAERERAAAAPTEAPSELRAQRRGRRLLLAAPVRWGGVDVGSAEIELDLAALVDPVLRENARRLVAAATLVTLIGVGSGVVFVAFLVGPLRRLRAGVERLSAGDLGVRVPPTSRDEVGELTRAFNQMGEALQEKERIQRAFGRYVSDYVLQQLLEGGEVEALRGAEREITIVFVDIRRFTELSEGLQAREVVTLLNEVCECVSEILLAHGGTIDKFIGDSVMAYFGAPLPQRDHPVRAVQAAIAIQRAIAERNRRAPADGRIPAEVGIGLHTGAVVVGNIGSSRRTDFTAVGDAVNVAHRLEKLARPGEILVSEAVQRRVRGHVRLRFQGEQQLPGRREPVHVYAVDLESEAAEGGAAAASPA